MAPGGIDILAPAKLNLYLGVHEGRDASGYHQADSLMVAIDLYDTIRLEQAAGLSVRCIPTLDIPEENNAAYRAAMALARATGREPNVAVTIEKRIPYKSGLGGASSNAAAVLMGLARWWGLDPDDRRIVSVAQGIGADVAFFLDGRPTLLCGRGDVVEEQFPALPSLPLVLVRPEGNGITAGEAYDEFDRDPVELPDASPILRAMREGDAKGIWESMANNLEPVAIRLMPEIGRVQEWLSEQEGVLRSMVTGSGSCTFAVCESRAIARRVAEAASAERGWWGRPAQIMESGASIAQ